MHFTQYQHVALGGTFDRLHKGHKRLLSVAAQFGQTITIGLTTKHLYNTKSFADRIESYAQRKHALATWLVGKYPQRNWQIISLTNPYGPTITKTNIQAIIATPHTLTGAQAINNKRQQKKLHSLPIHLAPLVSDNQGNYISSTRIRRGEIDREGRVLEAIFNQHQMLSQQQLNLLKSPLGTLIHNHESLIKYLKQKPTKLFAVGDIVSKLVLKHHLNYAHLVFDGHTKRSPLKHPIQITDHIHHITNPKGTINPYASKTIKSLVKSHHRHHIQVKGEEDLLVLPYIIHAPLHSQIIYGQPNQGCVLVTVNESIKSKIYHLLS